MITKAPDFREYSDLSDYVCALEEYTQTLLKYNIQPQTLKKVNQEIYVGAFCIYGDLMGLLYITENQTAASIDKYNRQIVLPVCEKEHETIEQICELSFKSFDGIKGIIYSLSLHKEFIDNKFYLINMADPNAASSFVLYKDGNFYRLFGDRIITYEDTKTITKQSPYHVFL